MKPLTSLAVAALPVLGALASEGASTIAKPVFTPTTLKAPFLEQFTDDWDTRWKISKATKTNDDTTEEELAYVGTWSVEEPILYKGMEGDNGLVIKDKAALHAISSVFSKPIDNTDKTLVVQYEVKLQDELTCGGAYLKLLRDTPELHTEEFSNTTPYVIMFGPDRCGQTNKVHFIFQHKNLKTGKYEEKHLRSPPLARMVRTTSLYTLIVNPDQTYEIRIDGKSVSNGSLFENFDPSVNPPAEIEDKSDVKTSDWVDNRMIADPEAKKPEDWDETEPPYIDDQDAVMPEGWLEDEPKEIPDPDATKPEDWDDDEDGDWTPVSVPNPKCAAVGCGPWKRPRKMNPNFKGKWNAPMIENPDYKGEWKPRMIPNPDYYEDKTPANLEPIGGIGFEIWTMNKDILFDNIIITHSIADAEAFQKETFDVKAAVEKAEREDSLKGALGDEAPESTAKASVAYAIDRVQAFIALARQDFVLAIQSMPEVAGGLGLLVVAFFVFISSLLGGSSNVPAKPKKVSKSAKADDTKEEKTEATTTGVSSTDGNKASRRK